MKDNNPNFNSHIKSTWKMAARKLNALSRISRLLQVNQKTLIFNSFIKACVHYFLSNIYFFNKWWPFENYKKCFLFHRKRSFCSRDIQSFVIFSVPFHTFEIRKDWFMMSWINLHKFADIIFGKLKSRFILTWSDNT